MKEIIFTEKKQTEISISDVKQSQYVGVYFEGKIKGIMYYSVGNWQAITNSPCGYFNDTGKTKCYSLKEYSETYPKATFFCFDKPKEIFAWLAE